MNIVVTGGAGFIGRNLIKALLKLGHNITVIYRETIPFEFNGKVQLVKYSGNYVDLEKNLTGKHIDIVVHLATYFTSNHKTEEILRLLDSNICFGTYLLEFMKNHNIKNFINTTTFATSIDESSYNPQNLYSATKKAFEDILIYYARAEKIKVINLELSDTYGPGDTRPKFLNLLLKAIINNEEFNMSPGEQEVCYIHVRDVINAYLKAIDLLIQGPEEQYASYSVYGPKVMTLNKLVEEVQTILGEKIKINKGFYPYRKREIMKYFPKYPKLPGWQPQVSLKEGILELVEEGKNNEDHADEY